MRHFEADIFNPKAPSLTLATLRAYTLEELIASLPFGPETARIYRVSGNQRTPVEGH